MSSAAAAEAKQISVMHQRWILQALKDRGGSCSYGTLVKVGEEHHCDTLGAMLKIMKSRKALSFASAFLMYPMNKDETITLVNPDYDPATA